MVWVCGLVVLLIVALWDLLSAKRVQPNHVRCADIFRFSKDRAGSLEIVLEASPGVGANVRFALALPPAFENAQEEQVIAVPEPGKTIRIHWQTTPRRRGRFSNLIACQSWESPMRLWEMRSRQPLACELRVYPNLFADRRQLAAQFLARNQSGAKRQRIVGRGRDFEKLRDYFPGDSFDEVHWKATAKRGRPITKVFQAERTQEIYVVIDASRLSARPITHDGRSQPVLERYLTSALILLLAAQSQGDRFGLVVYDQGIRTYLKSGYGAGHYGACREALCALQPNDGTPDMAEVVRALRMRIRRRALLVFLTDLTDPIVAEDFVKHARLLSRQHLVLLNQLRAPDVAPLFSGNDVHSVGEIYEKLAGNARWIEAQALAQKLSPLGVKAMLLEDATLSAQLVSQYLAVKQRQAL